MKVHPTPNELQPKDRAQIILASAIFIAFLILASVTYLNTAAFTDLDRADGVNDYPSDTLQRFSETKYGLEGTIEQVNHNSSITNNEERITHLENNIIILDEKLSNEFAKTDGEVLLNKKDTSIVNGTRIWQGEANTLVSPNGSKNWTVVSDTEKVRSFTISATGKNAHPVKSQAFKVDITLTNGDRNTFTIYANEADLTIEDQSENQCKTPITSSKFIQIGFSSQTLNGQHCDLLPGEESIQKIGFNNSNNIEAKFQLVTGTSSIIPEIPLQSSPSSSTGKPEAHRAIYSVTVETSVTSENSQMTTTFNVTPGLPVKAAKGD